MGGLALRPKIRRRYNVFRALLAALGWLLGRPKWSWVALGWLLGRPKWSWVVSGWPWSRPWVGPGSPHRRALRDPVRIHCIDVYIYFYIYCIGMFRSIVIQHSGFPAPWGAPKPSQHQKNIPTHKKHPNKNKNPKKNKENSKHQKKQKR